MTDLDKATEDTKDFTKPTTEKKTRSNNVNKKGGKIKGKKSELYASQQPPPDSTRAAVKTCHSRSPTKVVQFDEILFLLGPETLSNILNTDKVPLISEMFSPILYFFHIRGLILSLSKGEGYRTHTLVKEI